MSLEDIFIVEGKRPWKMTTRQHVILVGLLEKYLRELSETDTTHYPYYQRSILNESIVEYEKAARELLKQLRDR